MGLPNSKRRLSVQDIDYLKNNTKFNEKEIKKWYKGFMKECKSGQLTKEQFLEVYKSLFPNGDAEKFCLHVFRTFDQDNSGAIDFKEFLLAISVTSKGTPEQKLEFAFKMYDIDSSGSIEEVEMVKVIEAIFDMLGVDLPSERRLELARERARLIFERLDMNKDERLTAEEFVKGCLSDDEVLHLLTNMDRTQSV